MCSQAQTPGRAADQALATAATTILGIHLVRRATNSRRCRGGLDYVLDRSNIAAPVPPRLRGPAPSRRTAQRRQAPTNKRTRIGLAPTGWPVHAKTLPSGRSRILQQCPASVPAQNRIDAHNAASSTATSGSPRNGRASHGKPAARLRSAVASVRWGATHQDRARRYHP